ncbi:MAG: 4'-phosphopantetheinyl transferase superfamily protein [Planctomycetia bacterium]|nr:4'-phosphopantetheinyl transferase superfamily protein [Planctomycetia bacterium]
MKLGNLFFLCIRAESVPNTEDFLSQNEKISLDIFRHPQTRMNWAVGRFLIKYLARIQDELHLSEAAGDGVSSISETLKQSKTFGEFGEKTFSDESIFTDSQHHLSGDITSRFLQDVTSGNFNFDFCRQCSVISKTASGHGGRPRLFDENSQARKLYFSLTHSENHIAAAMNVTRPVGIDLCCPGCVTEAVTRHFFTESEQRLVRNATAPELLAAMIWASKEAAYKASKDSEESPFCPQKLEFSFLGDHHEPAETSSTGIIRRIGTPKSSSTFHINFCRPFSYVLAITESP